MPKTEIAALFGQSTRTPSPTGRRSAGQSDLVVSASRDRSAHQPIRPEMLADGLELLIAEMLVLAYTLIAMSPVTPFRRRSSLPVCRAC